MTSIPSSSLIRPNFPDQSGGYERDIQGSLAASERGKFLVLDIETGDYELDADELAAVKRARAKHPGGAFYFLRVGHSAAYRLGLKSLAARAC